MRPTPPQEEQVYRLDPQMTDPQAWKRCWMGNQPAALRCSYHDKRRFFFGHFSPMKFSAIVRHKKRRKRPQCLMVSHFVLGHTVMHGLFEMFEMKHCLQCNCKPFIERSGKTDAVQMIRFGICYYCKCVCDMSAYSLYTSLDMIRLDVGRISICPRSLHPLQGLEATRTGYICRCSTCTSGGELGPGESRNL